MSRAARFGPAALTAALLLAGCGGGGDGTSPAPAKPAAPNPSAAPAANRTAVGTATLVLKLPQVLRAKNGKTVTAKAANGRHAQFVDPAPAPTASGVPTAPTNLIDIYVDNTLVPNIDGNAGAYGASVEVTTANADGTQTIVLPIYSTSNNVIVAAEYDGTHNNLLAIGESNLGTFTAGTTNNISLTMQMNAQTLGIVDQPDELAPTAMNTANNGFGLTIFPCAALQGSIVQVGVYTVDFNGSFVPVGGYGGTGFVSVTGVSSGATSVSAPQSAFPGLYTISFDGSCAIITLTGSSPNPANAIYSDVQSTSPTFNNYDQGYLNNFTNGQNQGIFNLYNFYNPTNSFSHHNFNHDLSEAANATATGQIDVSNLFN
jgi:hypothetical protein